ncbi:hypothetical protein SEPCBS57363_001407 [Sporothrix epigloea]|uniref:Clr5 domain-containing protein n=1 Tax=Sporothrix epigloea TaxID=1892477 RepID=A0ABP0DA30_9PEZI
MVYKQRTSMSSGYLPPDGIATASGCAASSNDIKGDGRRHQQDWAQVNDWELHREHITELYRDQGLHLRQVQAIMSDRYHFHASQRMYKTRISKWAIDKNLKAAEVAAILRMQQSRAALGKASKFFIRGRDIDFARVEQYLKRDPTLLKQFQKADESDATKMDVIYGHAEAAGITCRTPSPTPSPTPSSPADEHQQHHPHHSHHPLHQQQRLGVQESFQQREHNYHHQHQQRQQHPHSLFRSHNSLPPTSISTITSHTPLSTPTMVTAEASFSSLPSATFSLPSPTSSFPMTTTASLSCMQYNSAPRPHMGGTAPHNSYGRDIVTNPPPLMSHDAMFVTGEVPPNLSASTAAPFHQGASIMSPTPPYSSAALTASASKDDLSWLMRDYARGAFQQGVWVPRRQISASASPYTYVSTKRTRSLANHPVTPITPVTPAAPVIPLTPGISRSPTADSADRLAAWSNLVHDLRRLLSREIISQTFNRVHATMDTLGQQLHTEDPALLYHILFHSIAFGTAAASTPDPCIAAKIRNLAKSLCKHVQSLAHIMLGAAHPVSRIFCQLFAQSKSENQCGHYCHSRIYDRAHLEALQAPMRALQEALVEHDPTVVDGAATAQCQRMAYLLRQAAGGRLVALDNVACLTAPSEVADIMARLQTSPNLHTQLHSFTTYLDYLIDRSAQTYHELAAQAAQATYHITSSPPDNGGEHACGSMTASVAASTYQLQSGAIPVATSGMMAAATAAAVSMQSPLSLSATSTPSSSASPGPTFTHLSSVMPATFLPGPMATDSSTSSLSPASSSMTTPRTVLASSVLTGDGGEHQLPTQQQLPWHRQSTYPPVPPLYHHQKLGACVETGHSAAMAAQTLNGTATAVMTVGGTPEPGSLTWELGDVVDMNWIGGD